MPPLPPVSWFKETRISLYAENALQEVSKTWAMATTAETAKSPLSAIVGIGGHEHDILQHTDPLGTE